MSDAANSASDYPEARENIEAPRRQTPIIIALILALLLVTGVLIGTKVMYSRIKDQPVSVASIDAPDATTSQCQNVLAAVPDELNGLDQAPLADPIPAGVAVWRDQEANQITLRCGIEAPQQYSEYATEFTAAGTSWFEVRDATPGLDLATWYAVGSTPLVAITAQGQPAQDKVDFAELTDALSYLDDTPQDYQPLALSDFKTPYTGHCEEFLSELPASIGDSPTYERIAHTDLSQSAVYIAAGLEPIVIRCGVEFPASYEPGAQLQQINGVNWMEDTTLGNGTTASTWYAIDRADVVVASMPQAGGSAALPVISNAIAATLAVDTRE
ncbi:MAG: DUF3515 domain-containing protein [Corynebacterium sp.]|nr:DUF3515 domain-containing protein [Corynebacterium sp.]